MPKNKFKEFKVTTRTGLGCRMSSASPVLKLSFGLANLGSSFWNLNFEIKFWASKS